MLKYDNSLTKRFFVVLLVLQKEQDPLLLLVAIFYSLYAFGIIFVTCELGQRLSDAFEEINDEIESFEWYQFSYEIQQMLPIILIVSQQPVDLECFGSITGCRMTFQKVSTFRVLQFKCFTEKLNFYAFD